MAGRLPADSIPNFNEGLHLVLYRWAALCDAIENELGGPHSRQKAETLGSDILHWFTQSKEPLYIDDLESMLDEGMLSLNVGIEDSSVEELTNILLMESLQAKLSDFGLAKMLGMEESKVFTDVRGTIGYMDPEYMSNAKLTCASDVYSFGIVALQILSGQKVIELDLDARDQLTRKARDVSMGRRPVSDFEDPRLKGQVNTAEFEAILHMAVLCVAKSSRGRPTIEVVFEELDKAFKNSLAHLKAKQEHSASTSISSHLIIT